MMNRMDYANFAEYIKQSHNDKEADFMVAGVYRLISQLSQGVRLLWFVIRRFIDDDQRVLEEIVNNSKEMNVIDNPGNKPKKGNNY